MKKLIIFVALAILIVAGIWLTVSKRDHPNTAQKINSPKDASINQSIVDSKIKFTVKQFQCDIPFAGNPDQYAIHELPQGHFCQASVRMENTTKEPIKFTYEYYGQHLIGNDGNKYLPSLSAMDIIENPLEYTKTIKPKTPIEVIMIFDIPKNVTPILLEVHDNINSSGIRFDVSNYKTN